MKRFLVVLAFVPCVIFAQDDSEVVEYRLEDDPELMASVQDLAVRLAGVNATTATVEDNVAAILSLLEHVYIGTRVIRTMPMSASSDGVASLGHLLISGLGDGWTPYQWDAQRSYLYEIQRALTGQSGIPSPSDALLPILKRLESSQNLSAIASTQLASRVSAQLVRKLEDYLDSADWNTLIYDVDGAYASLLSLDGNLYSLASMLSLTQGNLLSAIESFSNSVNSSSADLLSKLDDLYREVNTQISIIENLYVDMQSANDYLLDIKDSTYDTAVGVEHVFNWLVYSFEGVLVDALENLRVTADVTVTNQFPDRLYVNVENWPSDYEVKGLSAISNLLSGIHDESFRQGTNILGIASNTAAIASWHDLMTNFLVGAIATPSQRSWLAAETNAIATNLSWQALADEDELEDMTNSITSRMFDDVFDNSDTLVENPWNGGDDWIEQISGDIEDFFEKPDPTFSTELLLMGSDQTASQIGRLSLPRISVDVESILPDTTNRTLKSIMRFIWQFVGFALRWGMVASWLIWYSQRKKAV